MHPQQIREQCVRNQTIWVANNSGYPLHYKWIFIDGHTDLADTVHDPAIDNISYSLFIGVIYLI